MFGLKSVFLNLTQLSGMNVDQAIGLVVFLDVLHPFMFSFFLFFVEGGNSTSFWDT